MYTLYHGKGACSLAIQAALTLAKADFEVKQVNLSEGEHRQAVYLAINPFGKVPALDLGDQVLSEGMAMHLYLSQKYPNSGLFPEDISERAEAYRWLSFIYSNLHPLFSMLFSSERYSNDVESVKSKAAESLTSLFSHIGNQLKQHSYVAGDSLSAGDLYLMVQLHWAAALGLKLVDTYPSLTAYMERIYSHPEIGSIYRNEFSA